MMSRLPKKLIPLSLLAVLFGELLAGCAGTPATGTRGPVNIPVDGDLVPDTERVDDSIFTARISEAGALLRERRLLPAASILRDLDNSKLTRREQAAVLALETELRYLQGNTASALKNLRQQAYLVDSLEPQQREVLDAWERRLLLDVDGSLAAAAAADRQLLANEDSGKSEELRDFIWHNLQRTRVEQLQSQLEQASPGHWRGWLELALLAADVMQSPDVQVAQLDLWQQRYPQHRAANPLPGGLSSLASSALTPPARIALLLPMSDGPSERGRAVLEGYLAARFLGRQRGWPEQELMVMDTAGYADINVAYGSAVRAGAELVIGPLTPEELIGWVPPADRSVPMLALSWLPRAPDQVQPPESAEEFAPEPPREPADDPVQAFSPAQLALSPLDEAAQLAQLAFASGARDAMVVRPEGAWGDAVSDELIRSWTELEGRIQAIASYSGQADYSTSLKAALNLAESESRATRIRRLMAEPTEFSPRRRKDLDIIFLLSETPAGARSIKPLIAFHYAGDLPVYSTSQIFSGRRDPQRDRDLNGIQLVEIPWLLSPQGALQTEVDGAGGLDLLSDMHALGADAYMLNWRLAQLRESRDGRIRGQTGLLSQDGAGRIHRELVPARFIEGVPEPR